MIVSRVPCTLSMGLESCYHTACQRKYRSLRASWGRALRNPWYWAAWAVLVVMVSVLAHGH